MGPARNNPCDPPIQDQPRGRRAQDRHTVRPNYYSLPRPGAGKLAQRSADRGRFVFRPVDRHGRVSAGRLSGEAVSFIVRDRMSAAGFDPTGYSGHSLRAGFATSATRPGISTFKIRQETGPPLTRCFRVTSGRATSSSGTPQVFSSRDWNSMWALAFRRLGEDLCPENGGPSVARAADQRAEGNFA
jgi:hypothetical protein